MHAIHTTPGFIIDSRAQGEAGKYISVFTRDLGLVWAMAQGVRLEKSKLRYHLADHSFGLFSFVRGKEVWRLTNAEELDGAQGIGDTTSAAQELFARLALLLRRLLHGEEPNPPLFEVLNACHTFIANNDDIQTAESLTVLRIMHTLGYIGDDKEIHGFIYSNDYTPALLDLAARKRTLINQHINKALKESHL